MSMKHGQMLYSEGSGCQCFYILVSGRLLADPIPWPAGGGVPAPPLEPGCIVGAAGFFTHTPRRETVRLRAPLLAGVGIQTAPKWVFNRVIMGIQPSKRL